MTQLPATHSPIGHYRVPLCLRGKAGPIVSATEPAGLNDEEIINTEDNQHEATP